MPTNPATVSIRVQASTTHAEVAMLRAERALLVRERNHHWKRALEVSDQIETLGNQINRLVLAIQDAQEAASAAERADRV